MEPTKGPKESPVDLSVPMHTTSGGSAGENTLSASLSIAPRRVEALGRALSIYQYASIVDYPWYINMRLIAAHNTVNRGVFWLDARVPLPRLYQPGGIPHTIVLPLGNLSVQEDI